MEGWEYHEYIDLPYLKKSKKVKTIFLKQAEKMQEDVINRDLNHISAFTPLEVITVVPPPDPLLLLLMTPPPPVWRS